MCIVYAHNKNFRNKISILSRQTSAVMPPNTIPEPLNAEFESLNAIIQAVKHFVITWGESYLVSHAD